MADGKVVISTKLDNTGIEKGLAGLQGSIKKFAGVLGLAFGTAALVAYGKAAVQTASQVRSAMTGLQSIAEGQGRSFAEAKGFVQEFISDGLVPATNAVTAYKNLAMRGYEDDQIRQVMLALKDSSAYGRQASLSMGEAISSATEGLKNENSILVDNAGVTKNVSMMWKDYAKTIGVGVDSLTKQQKIQAEVNGILYETRFQTGDAAKVAGEYEGQLLGLKFALNDFKIALGNVLIPINQYIIPAFKSLVNAVTRVMNAIAQITGALFGTAAKRQQQVADSAGAAADAENELAQATKDAGKAAKGSLGAFDELNVLQQQTTAGAGTDTGAGAGGAAPPEMTPPDTEVLPSVIEAMVARVQALLAPLQAINFDNLAIAFGRLQEAIAPLGQALFAGLEWAYINLLVPLAQWTVEDVVPAFLTTLAAAFDVLTAALIALEPFGTWMWDTFLQPLGQWAGERIVGLLEALQKDFEAIGQWIGENVTAIELFLVLLGSFVTAFTLVTAAMGLFNAVCLIGDALIWGLVAAWTFLTSPIGLVVAAIAAVIAIIVLLIKNWDTVKEVGKRCVDAVLACWGVVAAWFDTNVIQPVASMFAALWEGVSAVFMTVWDTLSDAFKWYINGWLTLIENFANFFIRMINLIIDGLNMINFDIPDWIPGIGGKSFGISIPNIPELRLPRLATGAVIPANREFMAVLGDQKHGTNIEAPADLIRQIVREESGSKSGGESRVTLTIDGRVLGEFVIGYINDVTERTNMSPILI